MFGDDYIADPNPPCYCSHCFESQGKDEIWWQMVPGHLALLLHERSNLEPDALLGRDLEKLEAKRAKSAGEKSANMRHKRMRWSAYVFKVRGVGVNIETVHEEHTGPFSGTHARYVLHSEVSCPEMDTGVAE